MPVVASGNFDVTLTPHAEDPQAPGVSRMILAKRFHGDLEAVSHGQMLAFRPAVSDSGGYVAMEQIEGTLHGRSGSFVMQHSGTMDRAAQSLSITVVPDSGTGELHGISGKMTIVISGGQHAYQLEYALPETE